MKYYLEQTKEILNALETSKEGLTSSIVNTRLSQQGKNKLEETSFDNVQQTA